MIILPAIDLKEGKCVRLYRGRMKEVTIYSARPQEVAKRWEDQGGRFIHVVDLDGAVAGEPQNWGAVEAVVSAVEVPVEFGGGVRSRETMERLLDLGVTRAVLGTKALTDQGWLADLVEAFGERVVAGLDAREGKVTIKGWEETLPHDYLEIASRLVEAGAPRIIYTDVHRDGALEGPNLDGLRRLCEAVEVPVIASGGISRLDDVRAVTELSDLGVEGMIIGKALYEEAFSLKEAVEAVERVAR